MAFFLVLCNAFFVAAEYSFVRIRKTRLAELWQQGDKRAKLLLSMVGSLETYLGATQLGVTICSLGLGWIGEPAVSYLLTPLLSKLLPFISGLFISTMSFAISFSIITFLQIVLGELVPRTIVLQKVEFIALNAARPIYLFNSLIYPLVKLFNKSAQFILKIFSIDYKNSKENIHTQEEIRMLVDFSGREGVIDQMGSQIINKVFDFSGRMAREIMVPRRDVVCLYKDKSFAENINIIRDTKHTRYLFCDGDKDHIVGMIHVRDVIDMLFNDNDDKPNLENVMRKTIIMPEGMAASMVLQTLQQQRMQIAVIADEYGGTAGIVTIEDLLEEIVGDIKDEYDPEEEEVVTNSDGSFDIDGMLLVDTVENILKANLSEHDEDTIGGYIFGLLGRQPEPGDKVTVENYVFEVVRVEGYRVQRLKVCKIAESSELNVE